MYKIELIQGICFQKAVQMSFMGVTVGPHDGKLLTSLFNCDKFDK